MAVTADPPAVRPVTAWHFVRLRLTMTAGGLRGRSGRVALFVVGVLFALASAAIGYLLFAVPGLLDDARAARVIATFGGVLLVLGWLFLPLVFFGVDESLDPARFALLPLGRRTLLTGLFAAAIVGVPALATLAGTAGMIHAATLLGGAPAGLAALVGVLGGLLLCVAVSRAVTSAFASALRSRRARDLATMVLAGVVALLGPLQLVAAQGARSADWDRFAAVAGVLGWTPLGAPWTLGADVVGGRPWAVPVKILMITVSVGALLWWWSRTLESAMLGTAGSATGRQRPVRAGSPVAQLFGRWMPWLPRTRFGALTAREVRYWWRETRRRATLVTFTMVGVFLPGMFTLTGDPGAAGDDLILVVAGGTLVFVGVVAAINLANQFGFEGNAYAANIVAAVPARSELHSRVLGYSTYLGPLLLLISVVVGLLIGQPAGIPALLGTMAAAYGTGLAVILPVSVLGAYALPETSNPFAVSSGAGVVKGLLAVGALVAATVGTVPVLVAAVVLGEAWVWGGLPIGLAYGVLAYLLGGWLAGATLDRRMPELLAAISPNR